MSGRVKVVETSLKFKRPLQERTLTEYFVVHHVGEINRDVSTAEIHQWHLNRGWDGVGYHYVIRKNGSIERGRPRDRVGSHCLAQDSNFRSIGICIVGNFQPSPKCSWQPTYTQVSALANLLADLHEIYKLDPEKGTIKGHRDLGKTECPGDNLYVQLPDIAKKVKYLMQIKGGVKV